MTKLTKIQKKCLAELAEDNIGYVRGYKPAEKLAELGYAEWHDGKFGSSWLSITDAGRNALKEAE